jgi:transcriptional regulator CtsR
MARLSDLIEQFIKELLNQSEGQLELQRNEMADYFDCAPSQINYVLATRFSLDKGYIIESRRGGGGFVRIIRLDVDKDEYIIHLITERIGNRITQQEAENIIERMEDQEMISHRESMIMKAVMKDKVIAVPATIKESIRANLLKAMLLKILDTEGD